MKVYKVPKTQKKLESAYREVDRIDLSTDTSSWISEKKVDEINITLDGRDRSALARVVLSEKDVIALYEGLVKGWQKELAECEELRTELRSYKHFLNALATDLKFYLSTLGKLETSEKAIKRFEKMLSSIETFIKKNS